MIITLDGKKLEFNNPVRVIDLINDTEYKYLACLVDGNITDIFQEIDKDSVIELLDINTTEGLAIYQATLRYIVVYACRNLYPNAKVSFNYSVSRSIFASVGSLGHPLYKSNVDAIKKEVERIINADYKIEHLVMSTKDAIEFYKSIDYKDKVNSLKYRVNPNTNIHKCNDYMNYMYSILAPSTGYIKKYNILPYKPGFIIQYPRIEDNGEVPKFKDEPAFSNALRDANKWCNNTKCDTISAINNIIKHKKALEFINICEARHNSSLAHLGDKIENNIANIKLICVSGPSSSGKTTFTNRLRIELLSRGIEPFMISMDDFYKVKDYPIDKYGNNDYEHIEALDLELFDKTMKSLLKRELVAMPKFDFKTKTISFSKKVKLHENQPIIIEGIHALNPRIASWLKRENRFNIYIAPIKQTRIDNHNPISLSDIRLLRRMVRDYMTRNAPIEQTINMWKSVRDGEFKWIYPYQNNADFVFNSELTYELCVLKKHIISLLNGVKKDNPCFTTANRILKFLKYVYEIDDKWVPCNSILREFIGESIFYTEDIK